MTGGTLWAYLAALLAFAVALTFAIEWAWRRFARWFHEERRYPWEGDR